MIDDMIQRHNLTALGDWVNRATEVMNQLHHPQPQLPGPSHLELAGEMFHGPQEGLGGASQEDAGQMLQDPQEVLQEYPHEQTEGEKPNEVPSLVSAHGLQQCNNGYWQQDIISK